MLVALLPTLATGTTGEMVALTEAALTEQLIAILRRVTGGLDFIVMDAGATFVTVIPGHGVLHRLSGSGIERRV
jgi:hypothetical protein